MKSSRPVDTSRLEEPVSAEGLAPLTQRGAATWGNAAMQDLLRGAPSSDPEVGSSSAMTSALGDTSVSAAPNPAQPGGVATPAQDPKGRDDPPPDWVTAQPTSNRDYARLIILGGAYGFATFGPTALPELRALEAGKVYKMDKTIEGNGTVQETGRTIDGSREKLYTMLAIAWGLIQHKAARWLANPDRTNASKEPYYLGWLARDQPKGDAHSEGEAVDVNGYQSITVKGKEQGRDWVKWSAKQSGGQVLQMLNDLPDGDYSVGLPYNQYPGFPGALHLANQEEQALAKARGSNPVPQKGAAKAVGLVLYKTTFWTATYNPDKEWPWDENPNGRPIIDQVQDPALKGALMSGLPGKRFVEVFPDNSNHVHIKLLNMTSPAGDPTHADAEESSDDEEVI